MVPWLLVSSEYYKMQNLFESVEFPFFPKWQKLATDIYLDMNTLAHINVNTYSNFCENVADEASPVILNTALTTKSYHLKLDFSRRALKTELTAFSPPFFSSLVSGVINNFWVF